MSISKRINIVFIVFATVVTFMNVAFYTSNNLLNDLTPPMAADILVPLASIISLLALHWSSEKLCRIAHVLYLFIMGTLPLISDSAEAVTFGMCFILIGFYLSYKYGFLTRNRITKFIAFFVILISVNIVLSMSTFGWLLGVSTVAFILFFCSVLFIGELELIKKYNKKEKEMDEAIEDMRGKKIDLKEKGFTKRELEIGKLLLQNKVTDRELSEKIGISSNTMRNHMKSMRMKLKIHNKQQLIDGIRWYYHTQEKNTSTDTSTDNDPQQK